MRFLGLLLLLVLLGASGFAAWLLLRPGPASSPGPAPRPEPVAVAAPPRTAPAPAASAAPSGPTAGELNALAIERLEAGELLEAVGLFERCVELEPGEEVFRTNLAEALARLAVREHELPGREARALALLERAVELAPGREDLARLLERWRNEAEAERDFAELVTEHFVIRFDYQRAELSEEFYRRGDLEQLLEATYHELGEAFARYPVEEGRARIEVVVYGREAFDRVTGLGHWAAGVFDGTVRVPVDSLAPGEKRRLGRVLRHELLHAFAHEVGGAGVPGWLGEGLAQWVEEHGGNPVLLARQRLAGTELFPLEDLRGPLAGWTDTAAIGRAYAQSLVLVDQLVRRHGERLPFQLVERVGQGAEAQAAFTELTLGRSLADELADLRQELEAR